MLRTPAHAAAALVAIVASLAFACCPGSGAVRRAAGDADRRWGRGVDRAPLRKGNRMTGYSDLTI